MPAYLLDISKPLSLKNKDFFSSVIFKWFYHFTFFLIESSLSKIEIDDITISIKMAQVFDHNEIDMYMGWPSLQYS